MLIPKVERLPSVTVEFLRIVRGIEAVRLQCKTCKSVQVVSWGDLGLSDDALFPPEEGVWECGRCGGSDITATLEEGVDRGREGRAPSEALAPPGPPDAATEDDGSISADLRGRLDAVMARLGQAKG